MREHCHFYCDSCDTVFDVDLPAKAAAGVALPKGFRARHFEIAIQGICPDCAKKK
jgi:Fur family peroxide stress response transcriptional regulator